MAESGEILQRIDELLLGAGRCQVNGAFSVA
jgi:hypothetical protein